MTVEHREHVTDWWCEVMGGRHASSAAATRTLRKHLGLAITPEQRRRFVTLLSEAADVAGLPDDPEFRAAIGYAEWGTRLAMHNSKPGAESCRRRRCRAGAGASRRPTRPDAPCARG